MGVWGHGRWMEGRPGSPRTEGRLGSQQAEGGWLPGLPEAKLGTAQARLSPLLFVTQ